MVPIPQPGHVAARPLLGRLTGYHTPPCHRKGSHQPIITPLPDPELDSGLLSDDCVRMWSMHQEHRAVRMYLVAHMMHLMAHVMHLVAHGMHLVAHGMYLMTGRWIHKIQQACIPQG